MATQVKPKMHRPPPGEPWSPLVYVILDPDEGKFHFESDDIEIGPDNEITFSNDGQPGFVITFRLKDPRHGYRFPEDLKTALWAIGEEVCPEEEHHWGQFKAKAVNDNGVDLVVRNLNEHKHKFGYSLLVTKDGGQSFWRLDPIGTNTNGDSA
jgi:hypothetical protein